MKTIKEALEDGSLSLEDEIDYDDTPQAEEIALLKLEIDRLKNILDKLDLLDKDIDKETKFVNMTVTLPKWLKDIGRKNKINFSKLLQESLYEVLKIGDEKNE